MLKNILRPKWRHPDAAVRRRAIEDGKPEPADLVELARTDSDATVRALAIRHIADIGRLLEVAEQGERNGREVAGRLHELLLAADPQTPPIAAQLRRCHELCVAQEQRASLLLHAPFVELRLMMVDEVESENVLKECVLNDKSSEVRRTAMARVQAEDNLRELSRQMRGRDKSIARMADERLSAMAAQRARATLRQAVMTELQAVTDAKSALNESTLNRLEGQWRSAVEDASSEEQQRFKVLWDALQPRLAEYLRNREQQKQYLAGRESTLGALRVLGDGMDELTAEEAQARFENVEEQWRQLPDLEDGDTQQRLQREFSDLGQAVRGLISGRRGMELVQQQLDSAIAKLEAWLAKDHPGSKVVKQAREIRDRQMATVVDKQRFEPSLQRLSNLTDKLEHRLKDRQQAEKDWQRELKQRAGELEQALVAHDYKPAAAAHKRMQKILAAVGEPRPTAFRELENRMHRSEPDLRKLRSLRDWSTDHAREELIAEARALHQSAPTEVAKLAKQIGDLRDRWKALGQLGPSGKSLWETFDAACTRAYEPVKIKRDAEAEVRKQNLEVRAAICAELEALTTGTDWEQPDWRALDKALQGLRNRWNKAGGVPHKSWAVVRKRFDQAVKALDKHLDQERERNLRMRQELVSGAEALAGESDNRTATAAARELRKEWQVTVRSRPRQERDIWNAFNKAMDQVFSRDRAARDEFKVKLEENQRQAEALCEDLEKLGQADDATLRGQRPEVKLLQDQFRALDNLPKQSRRQLEKRFDDARKAMQQRLKKADEALEGERLNQLYALHRLCEQAEGMALAEARDTTAVSELAGQWERAQKPAREKLVLSSLEKRFRNALSVINGEQSAETLGDLGGNTERKRGICTDLEILLGLASPEAEGERRMKRQIEILENAMKGGDENSPGHIRELRLAFLLTGPVAAQARADLEGRFSGLWDHS